MVYAIIAVTTWYYPNSRPGATDALGGIESNTTDSAFETHRGLLSHIDHRH